MKIKTSELIGLALDWAVATIECKGELSRIRVYPGHFVVFKDGGNPRGPCSGHDWSTDWAQGGPMMEAHDIMIVDKVGFDVYVAKLARAVEARGKWSYFRSEGPTQLIAAMRCRVRLGIGDEVEVPGELL